MNDPEFSAGTLNIILAYTKETYPAAEKYLSELDGAAGIRASAIGMGENDVRYIARSAKDYRALFIGIIAYDPPDGDIISALLASAPVYLIKPDSAPSGIPGEEYECAPRGMICRLLPSGKENMPEGWSLIDIARGEAEARVDAMAARPNGTKPKQKDKPRNDPSSREYTPEAKRRNAIVTTVMLIGFAMTLILWRLLSRLIGDSVLPIVVALIGLVVLVTGWLDKKLGGK